MAKKKTTATMLAFIGGVFGLHKFYLRDPGAGIFYLVLTYIIMGTFGLPITFILGIIDAFKLMSMSEEQFDEKYNTSRRARRARRREYKRRPTTSSRQRREIEIERERYRYKENRKVKRNNPFKKSAQKKKEDFDLEDAIRDYQQALEISPGDSGIHYEMAASYSLLENKEKAYFHIEKAKELGFKKLDDILTKDDFAFLRIQDDFEKFKENGYSQKEVKSLDAPKGDLLQDDLLLSQLNKLKELRERGLLSEKEFKYEKEKLMRR